MICFASFPHCFLATDEAISTDLEHNWTRRTYSAHPFQLLRSQDLLSLHHPGTGLDSAQGPRGNHSGAGLCAVVSVWCVVW